MRVHAPLRHRDEHAAPTAVAGSATPTLAVPFICDDCGFAADAITPAAAAAELRSLALRFRTVLRARDVDPMSADRPGGWSPLQHAAHIRDVLHVAGNRLARFLVQDRPVIAEVDIEAPHAGDIAWHPDAVLGVLSANAERLARLVESMPHVRWQASATRGASIVTAHHVLSDAIHHCVHHLALAEAHR